MPHRYSISLATVVMLVLLRLCIGWHFFSEGVKHHSDAHWTSEPFLRAAKGPLAPLYHSYLPDFHGFDELLHGNSVESEPHVVDSWVGRIQSDWNDHRQQFVDHYGLNDTQQKRADGILKDQQASLRAWAAENKDSLATHVHQWRRKEATREMPSGEVPFQKQRVAQNQSSLSGEAAGWLAELKKAENTYYNELSRVLNVDQRSQPPMPQAATSLDTIDTVMTCTVLSIGLLLILGLVTRLACLAGAAFLLSVIVTQPFWIADAKPTFNESVELFALLALATTQVGRWGGLDFFVTNFISGTNRSTKGAPDVPPS